MGQLICTYGSVLDTRAVFVKVCEMPEIREIASLAYLNIVGDKRMNRLRSMEAVIHNLKSYLTKVLQTKGSRSTLDQRAYRTVLAACSGTNLLNDKYMILASRALVSTIITP